MPERYAHTQINPDVLHTWCPGWYPNSSGMSSPRGHTGEISFLFHYPSSLFEIYYILANQNRDVTFPKHPVVLTEGSRFDCALGVWDSYYSTLFSYEGFRKGKTRLVWVVSTAHYSHCASSMIAV